MILGVPEMFFYDFSIFFAYFAYLEIRELRQVVDAGSSTVILATDIFSTKPLWCPRAVCNICNLFLQTRQTRQTLLWHDMA